MSTEHSRSTDNQDVGAGKLFHAKSWVWSLILVCFGLTSLFAAEVIQHSSTATIGQTFSRILETAGVTLIAGAGLALIIEVILKQQRDQAFRDTLNESLNNHIPQHYKNMRRFGVRDCFQQLDIMQLQDKIKNARNNIRIMVIWVPNLDQLRNALIYAMLNNNVNIEILIAHPDQRDALKKRASTVPGYSEDQYESFINLNLRTLASIPQDKFIEKTGRASNMKVRLYRGFISTAIYGYGDDYLLGLYLNNRLSTTGMQFRIGGSGSAFYREIDEHFDSCWDNSEQDEIKDWGPYQQKLRQRSINFTDDAD